MSSELEDFNAGVRRTEHSSPKDDTRCSAIHISLLTHIFFIFHPVSRISDLYIYTVMHLQISMLKILCDLV